MTITIILALDVLITLLACGIMGPAAFKLGGIGLIGRAARAPFYLLRLYIGPAVLLTLDLDSWYMTGPLLGAALTLPLALWSTVPGCPAAEKWLNLTSGVLQGFLLAYATVDRSKADFMAPIRPTSSKPVSEQSTQLGSQFASG